MGRWRLQPEMKDKRIHEIKGQRREQQRENTKNNNENKPKGPKQKTEHSNHQHSSRRERLQAGKVLKQILADHFPN